MEVFKDKNPDIIIGVGGCVASQEEDFIRQRAPSVDIVFGPQTLHRLPEMINQVQGTRSPVIDISFLKLKNLTAYQNLVLKARPHSFPLWKAVTSIVPSV